MSRAFVSEDGAEAPPPRFPLPARDDPAFAMAAAEALLAGANLGHTDAAEAATGHAWGDPALHPVMEVLLAAFVRKRDDRMVQLAERFLGR
ncbi:MAG: hypothetical protein NW201_05790 [Gemmatimonadales bacterium]|nr:hypothetical protein [Gemmatimonadales bacterium]